MSDDSQPTNEGFYDLSQLETQIGEAEEKLQGMLDRFEQFQRVSAQNELSSVIVNPQMHKDSLTYFQTQIRQMEDELVELLRQQQNLEGLDPTSSPPVQAQFEWASSASDPQDNGREQLRQKLYNRLTERKNRQTAILQQKLTEIKDLLGSESEAFKLILKAVEADDTSDVGNECILRLRDLAAATSQPNLQAALFKLFEVESFTPGYWAAHAIVVLGGRNINTLLPPFQERLNSPNWQVRTNAVMGVEQLAQRPRFPNPRTAFELNGSLVTGEPMDDRLLTALLPMLADPYPKVRQRAVTALCHTGDSRATGQLVRALEDPVREVRISAAAFIGTPGHEAAIEPLLAAYERYPDDKDLRQRITQSLDFLGYKGDAIPLKDSFLTQILQGLSGLNSEQAAELAEEFRDKNEAGDEAGMAALMGQVMQRRVAPEGVEPLIAALQDPISSVRTRAAGQLGFLKDERAIEPLLTALTDPDKMVRNNVIMSLGLLEAAAAVAPLLAILSDEREDEHSRTLAASSLGRIGDRRATAALLAFLPISTTTGDKAAESNLAPTSANQNENLSRDEQDGLKIAAIGALGQLGDLAAYGTMLEYTKSENTSISYSAMVALGEIARHANEATRDGTLELLVDRLRNDPNEEKRMAAAYGLGELGDKRAISHLEWAIENDPYHPEDYHDACVHNAAHTALEQLRDAEN